MSRSSDTTVIQSPENVVLLQRLLDVIEHEILPLTETEVAKGNKVFGAALLRKSDYSTYRVATNNEMQSPLHHGEMHLLKHYFEIEADHRTPASDLIFFSTHEPCTMCLSAITWAGFDNFYYFFTHEDSRDAFNIPHDLRILDEVFGLEPGGYNRNNLFWHSHSINSLLEYVVAEASAVQSTSTGEADIAQSDDSGKHESVAYFQTAVKRIKARYREVSERYQFSKSDNAIPLK